MDGPRLLRYVWHMESTGRVPHWTLGDRLMKARRDAGMSQEQMAETLLVSRNTVVSWERDQHRPPRRKLAAWALRTGVDLVWITSDSRDTGRSADSSTGWFGRQRAVAYRLRSRMTRHARAARIAEQQAQAAIDRASNVHRIHAPAA